MFDESRVAKLSAIEALRNGVPNSDAVRELGCGQPKAEKRFRELLETAANERWVDPKSNGLLVSGEFGSGKSHLLAHLEHIALDEGFVCSRVSISKETPLFDLNKVLQSAVDTAVVPSRRGLLIEELDLASKRETDGYGRFFGWLSNETENRQRMHAVFLGTLVAYMGSQDFDLKSRIEGFWAGDRIIVSHVKAALREMNKRQFTAFRAPRIKELPPQRLRFLCELIKGAGYKGWVVLIDELELIGSYSVLQRGRAYAELARWLRHEDVPGLVTVGAVTGEFASVIISPQGRRRDWDKLPPKLLSRPLYKDLVDSAEFAMRQLWEDCLALKRPTSSEIESSLQVLQRLYSDAYGWDAPKATVPTRGVGLQRTIRYKVRAAINEWDLKRLDPKSEPETVLGEIAPAFQEGPKRTWSPSGSINDPWAGTGPQGL